RKVRNFTAQLTIPVLPLLLLSNITEHAQCIEILSAEILMLQELNGFRLRNMLEAFQSVEGGLIAHTEMMRDDRYIFVGNALRARCRTSFSFNLPTAGSIKDRLLLTAWKPLVETSQNLIHAVSRHEE